MGFFERLEEIARDRGTNLCVGLDPYFPVEERKALGDRACIARARKANLRIIEATAPYAACYKPNIAFYEAFGNPGMDLLRLTLRAIPSGIPVIIDAKRGDIDSTARAYADEIFDGLGADAVTLSPYMGKDSAAPFLQREDKGVFMLCRTSNPGAGALQDLMCGGEPLYVRAARECASWGRNVGLVVAGNDPAALALVRAAAPSAWFLSPGIGAQGGNAFDAMKAGARADGSGILVVAARSVAGASDPGAAARDLRDSMRKALGKTPAAAGWTPPDLTADTAAASGRPAFSGAPETHAAAGKSEGKDFGGRAREAFIDCLIGTGCFRLGDFVLKSGKRSPFYIDLRKLVSDPAALAAAAQAYSDLAAECEFDRLAGIPAAGLPLATAAGLSLCVPMIWPRMPVKEHGTGNRIEGEYKAGETALLLDDLITTGASKLEAVDILRSEGLVVSDLVVLIERGKQGRKDMEAAGIKLHAYLHVKDLFEACERRGMIDSAKRVELDGFVDRD